MLRVSWKQAMGFCRWLSRETGLEFTLPTEARWEYACRAGSATPLSYGAVGADFSKWANVADMRVANGGFIREVLVMSYPADERFDDGHMVTAPAGSYRPNAWGLYDMHGNAAEWTISAYRSYPYGNDEGRNDGSPMGRKVVRGGSFFDRPSDAVGHSIPRTVAEDDGNGYIGEDGDFVDAVLFLGRAEKPSPGGTQTRDPEFTASALWEKGTVEKGHCGKKALWKKGTVMKGQNR